MLDIEPVYLEMVKNILTKFVPDCRIIAFGSRTTGKAWKHSDLDLAAAAALNLYSAALTNISIV